MCIFNDFDNKDNKFRLNRIVFPLRDKRYLTFFSQFRSVLALLPPKTQCFPLPVAMHCNGRCNALSWPSQRIA